MQYLVYGIDERGVEERLDELAEVHWAYMDPFAEQLLARGPTLSPDGTAHTGSVHVLEAPDRGAAERFAFEEPFARAGLYSAVTVTPFWNALAGTMWDRPPASADTASTLVVVRWPERLCEAEERAAFWCTLTNPIAHEALVFGGLLLAEDEREVVGLAVALDQDLSGTKALLEALGGSTAPTSIVSQRWSRGGRPAG